MFFLYKLWIKVPQLNNLQATNANKLLSGHVYMTSGGDVGASEQVTSSPNIYHEFGEIHISKS